MNDSFLEDLELIPKEPKKVTQQVDRHVTTRHATSSPLLRFSKQDEKNIIRMGKVSPTVAAPYIPDVKITCNKDLPSKDSKGLSDNNVKKRLVKIKTAEKREKVESKGCPTDIKLKTDNNKQLQEARHVKISENKIKENNRQSTSSKETVHSIGLSIKENKHSPNSSDNHSSDISSKENSRPSESSRDSGSYNLIKEKEKLQANCKKSNFKLQNQDPVVLLSAIKELISMYTKQESTKILRTMQELHINSQATLIKTLLYQTDDLIKEMHPSKDSLRVKSLIEDNKRLEEELFTLKMQNEDLQSKLRELEFLKQENAALKLKYELNET